MAVTAARGAALATAAAGTTATAATTTTAALTLGAMFAAAVAVGRMALAMALGGIDTLGTAGAALGTAAAGATATAATTTTAIAIGTAFTTARRGLRRSAGEGGLADLGGRGAEETFDPTEEAGRLFGGTTAGDRGARSDRSAGTGRGVACRAVAAITRLLLGATIARLLAVAIATTTTGALAAAAVGAGGVAAGVGGTLEHGHFATALRTEHRAFRAQR
jgi:hypothetical protein